MRALIVSCVYQPEPVVSAQICALIAKTLANAGHTVMVLANFPSRPAGKLFPGYSRRVVRRERSELGIEIVRCFSTLSPKSRMLSRLSENLSFGLTSGWQALVTRRPDVIYAHTWPIVAMSILFVVAKLRRIPLVIVVQDVYPEVLVAQQRIRDGGLLARFLRWIDGAIARHSAHVVVISERFSDIYRSQRGVRSNRLSFVPNWIDAGEIDILVPSEQFRSRKGIDTGDFLLVYGGNIGVAAGVETAIESMHHLADCSNLRLLVAGAGSQLSACRELAKHTLGDRVLFHSPWLLEETSEVLRSADVLLLPTQGVQSLASMPSKLLSYMLSGRPVIATAVPESNLADFMDLSKCGWVVEPDRPDLLAAKIKEVMQLDPDERERRGDLGRSFVLQHFTKEICLPKVIKILEGLGK